MADNSAYAQLERQCDRLTNENVELLRALGEARRELATYTGFWKEECRRTVNAIERQIEAERELGAARPVPDALEVWLRATNYVDAWGPRDRLRKLGYAWMRGKDERNDLYDRLRARAKRWKRLAQRLRRRA